MSELTTTELCDDLDAGIAEYSARGFRLDMIFPADAPCEALMSRGDERLRLSQKNRQLDEQSSPTSLSNDSQKWIRGRAGMEYRGLLPDRLNGRLIASHIRLTKGGEVPDYVHYHKVSFQMIYCVAGAIKVVYEDQGPPFWLRPGDLVLQPPEIRHRVLQAEAGSEVIELGVPALHETWVDHELQLPTEGYEPDRDFGGQRFVRHVAADALWSDAGSNSSCGTHIKTATSGIADVTFLRLQRSEPFQIGGGSVDDHIFLYCLDGAAQVVSGPLAVTLCSGSGLDIQRSATLASASAELVAVTLSGI